MFQLKGLVVASPRVKVPRSAIQPAQVLATNLRAIRATMAVNQRETAARLGAAQRRLWAIETGGANISMRLIGEIARSLRVTPAALLTPGAFQSPT
jgi:transcriptional regulator with XRE-family HTH domain